MRSSSIAISFGVGWMVLALCPACGGGDDQGSTSNGGTTVGAAGNPMNEAGATEQPGGGEAQGGASSGASATGGSSSGGLASAGMSSGGASLAGMSTGGTMLYLPCESAADCKAFGGGKVCCAMGAMHFCTKPSGCSGDILP